MFVRDAEGMIGGQVLALSVLYRYLFHGFVKGVFVIKFGFILVARVEIPGYVKRLFLVSIVGLLLAEWYFLPTDGAMYEGFHGVEGKKKARCKHTGLIDCIARSRKPLWPLELTYGSNLQNFILLTAAKKLSSIA